MRRRDQNIGLSGVPAVSPVYVLDSADTFVVLASDGLWDVTSYQAAADVLLTSRAGRSAQYLAQKLTTQATSSFQCNDNVTTCVVKLGEAT